MFYRKLYLFEGHWAYPEKPFLCDTDKAVEYYCAACCPKFDLWHKERNYNQMRSGKETKKRFYTLDGRSCPNPRLAEVQQGLDWFRLQRWASIRTEVFKK